VIVGEDLGTVAPEVPDVLAKWGILSSSVLYFERGHDGSFRSAREYSERALVTATTHDHVPLAGFWTGRDLDVRAQAGFVASEDERRKARQERKAARKALLEALIEEGVPLEEELATPEAVCAAVYTFLARTPAPLVGVSLDDLAGEEEPVNLPGIPVRRYRNWSRRMRRMIEELLADPGLKRVLAEMRAARSDPEPASVRS
jgi:4-alpha-glucanotransferase